LAARPTAVTKTLPDSERGFPSAEQRIIVANGLLVEISTSLKTWGFLSAKPVKP
jgi:hypothetical protein